MHEPVLNTQTTSPDPVTRVLGGRAVWRRRPSTPMAVHEAVEAGIPWAALDAACAHYPELDRALVLRTVGVSLRTVQRKAADASSTLSVDQGARLWNLAEVLTKAEELLGSREEAVHWVTSPALALEQRRPIDLLTTGTGSAMVRTLLEQMEFGVYA